MIKETKSYQQHLGRCMTFLLKPLVRILIRSGVGFSDFAEWAKFAYVEVAEKEFSLEGKSQSTSRIAILTGLHRKEVARIRNELANNKAPEIITPANRAERVINAWLRDPVYTNAENIPLDLPLSSPDQNTPSFEMLVKTYSGDIHSSTLLAELERIDAVEALDNNHLHLKRSGYVPNNSSIEQVNIASQSAHDLLASLSKNIDPENSQKLFQRQVAYKHLSKESVQKFKQYSDKENEKLLLKLNKWLAQHDMSIAEQKQSSCQYRAGVGIYYFEEPGSKPGQS